jgi:hypothetical protein
MKLFFILFLFSFSFVLAQQKQTQKKQTNTDEIDLGETGIKIDREVPRVTILKSRKKPVFPEIPIKKDFTEEILDKYNNNRYWVEKRKIVITIDIDIELNKIN